jgi:hypothetical protein
VTGATGLRALRPGGRRQARFCRHRRGNAARRLGSRTRDRGSTRRDGGRVDGQTQGSPIYDQLVRERGDVLVQVRVAYDKARAQVEQDVRDLSRRSEGPGNWFS